MKPITFCIASAKNEKEYTKAVMQRVNYYIKRGFSNVIEIK